MELLASHMDDSIITVVVVVVVVIWTAAESQRHNAILLGVGTRGTLLFCCMYRPWLDRHCNNNNEKEVSESRFGHAEWRLWCDCEWNGACFYRSGCAVSLDPPAALSMEFVPACVRGNGSMGGLVCGSCTSHSST